MPPKGYVIAQIAQIDDRESYARYRELVGPTVASHNGQFFGARRRSAADRGHRAVRARGNH
jgi:uncharacterized protein (DUF1330 family)